MKLLIQILMILLLLTTQGIAKVSDGAGDFTEHDTISIRKGAISPFSGVLLSAPRYRLYNEKERIADELKDKRCPECPVQPPCPEFHGLSFLGGVTLGVSFMAIVGAFRK